MLLGDPNLVSVVRFAACRARTTHRDGDLVRLDFVDPATDTVGGVDVRGDEAARGRGSHCLQTSTMVKLSRVCALAAFCFFGFCCV